MATHSVGSGPKEKEIRSCLLCKTKNQAEFTAEINVHFRGLKNIDNSGVLFVPNVVVCLDCGFSRFTTPETELARLGRGVSAN
jgi:hypothetical protein